MASNLRVDQITASTAGSVSIGTATFTGGLSGDITGLNVTGVITATTLNQNVSGVVTATGGFVVGTGATISGSTNTITASTNGSERVRVDSSGNVGIGTDNPTTKLEIQSSANDSLDNPQTIFLRDRNTAGEGKGPGLTFGFDYSASGSYINRAGQIKCIKENSTDNNYASALIFGTTAHATSTAERLRITSGGNVQIANGNLVFSTSGTGIDFSATANSSGTTTSELLDDYERGSFTPKMSFGGSDAGVTYISNDGEYIKIGNLVHCYGIISLSSKGSATGNAGIFNLPFASSNDAISGTSLEGGGHNIFQNNLAGTIYGLLGLGVLANNTLAFYYYVSTTGGVAGNATNNNFSNTYDCRFTLSYYTDS